MYARVFKICKQAIPPSPNRRHVGRTSARQDRLVDDPARASSPSGDGDLIDPGRRAEPALGRAVELVVALLRVLALPTDSVSLLVNKGDDDRMHAAAIFLSLSLSLAIAGGSPFIYRAGALRPGALGHGPPADTHLVAGASLPACGVRRDGGPTKVIGWRWRESRTGALRGLARDRLCPPERKGILWRRLCSGAAPIASLCYGRGAGRHCRLRRSKRKRRRPPGRAEHAPCDKQPSGGACRPAYRGERHHRRTPPISGRSFLAFQRFSSD
jgi:hypothetical protein